MTLRSEGQFNTVVYEEEDLYRGNRRRDTVMMAAADAEARGLAEGDRVTVATEAGRLRVSVAVVDIRPGNLAMYYPEANELVPPPARPAVGNAGLQVGASLARADGGSAPGLRRLKHRFPKSRPGGGLSRKNQPNREVRDCCDREAHPPEVAFPRERGERARPGRRSENTPPTAEPTSLQRFVGRPPRSGRESAEALRGSTALRDSRAGRPG